MRGKSEILDRDAFVRLIRQDIARVRSQVKWARAAGVSRPNLNMMLNGHREPSAPMIEALGLEKTIGYRPFGEATENKTRNGIKILDNDGVLDLIRAELERAGGQSAWA